MFMTIHLLSILNFNKRNRRKRISSIIRKVLNHVHQRIFNFWIKKLETKRFKTPFWKLKTVKTMYLIHLLHMPTLFCQCTVCIQYKTMYLIHLTLSLYTILPIQSVQTFMCANWNNNRNTVIYIYNFIQGYNVGNIE